MSELSLLDRAQIHWFQRFLASPEDEEGRITLDYEVYRWAVPKTPEDSYPSLATVTWPG